jgi:hypothetical protein
MSEMEVAISLGQLERMDEIMSKLCWLRFFIGRSFQPDGESGDKYIF